MAVRFIICYVAPHGPEYRLNSSDGHRPVPEENRNWRAIVSFVAELIMYSSECNSECVRVVCW